MPEVDHPLLQLLKQYVNDVSKVRERHRDLNDLEFNTTYGLTIHAPAHWPVIESVQDLLEYWQGFCDKFLIIYPSTSVYTSVSQDLNVPNVSYFAWHEMYVAMIRSSQDTRFIRDLRSRIEESKMVIFLGFSEAMPEVIDQIRGLCRECLILLE